MTSRRHFLRILGVVSLGAALTDGARAAGFFEFLNQSHRSRFRQLGHAHADADAPRRAKRRGKARRGPAYQGAENMEYASAEKPGTIIIDTPGRALYRVLGNGMARRYMVAVGKEGFEWSGVAHVGMKRENPVWTPPPEMIERSPEYAKWADGMPGGLPINPLGPRAMYLYDEGGDTGFRIHGTIHPESIGHAASSGCIRMLNREVIELYDLTRIGTKVIVI